MLTHRQYACNDAFSIALPVNESHSHGLFVNRRWPSISMQSETMRHPICLNGFEWILNGLGRISAYKLWLSWCFCSAVFCRSLTMRSLWKSVSICFVLSSLKDDVETEYLPLEHRVDYYVTKKNLVAFKTIHLIQYP